MLLLIPDESLTIKTITNILRISSIGKSEAIYQTFTYIGLLAWNYISSKIPTDVSYICFKNYAKLHI